MSLHINEVQVAIQEWNILCWHHLHLSWNLLVCCGVQKKMRFETICFTKIFLGLVMMITSSWNIVWRYDILCFIHDYSSSSCSIFSFCLSFTLVLPRWVRSRGLRQRGLPRDMQLFLKYLIQKRKGECAATENLKHRPMDTFQDQQKRMLVLGVNPPGQSVLCLLPW